MIARTPSVSAMFAVFAVAAALGLAAPPAHADEPRPYGTVWYLPTGHEGIDLFVREVGEGDPVVVVHGGFGAEHSYLLPAFDGFYGDHRFIFYDQRGSLRSAVPDDRVEELVTLDAHIEDLERLRIELELDRMAVFAHSMGTHLAMAYAERYPQRVERLILVSAILPKAPTTEEESALYAEQQRRGGEIINRPEVEAEIAEEGLDVEDLSDLSAREQTFHWRIRFAGANIHKIERWRDLRGGRAFYNQAAGSAAGRALQGEPWNYLDDIREHAIPTFIIAPERDLADPGVRLTELWFGPLPSGTILRIPEAGHNAWIDQPALFRSALRDTLANEDTGNQRTR